MFIQIHPTSYKKVIITLSTLIGVRVIEILTDYFNCVEYKRSIDSIECRLPNNVTAEDVAFFFSEYFGASCEYISDGILVAKQE